MVDLFQNGGCTFLSGVFHYEGTTRTTLILHVVYHDIKGQVAKEDHRVTKRKKLFCQCFFAMLIVEDSFGRMAPECIKCASCDDS